VELILHGVFYFSLLNKIIMGLDMYLHRGYVRKCEFKTDYVDGKPELNIKVTNLESEEVGYWRKANHIHNWFVQNVQGGKDDCNDYAVTLSELRNLRNLCEHILHFYNNDKLKKAEEEALLLLPPVSGFFFGSTEIDEYYYNELQYTIKTIDGILESHADENNDCPIVYVYHASW